MRDGALWIWLGVGAALIGPDVLAEAVRLAQDFCTSVGLG